MLRNAIVQPHAKVYTNNAGCPRCVYVLSSVSRYACGITHEVMRLDRDILYRRLDKDRIEVG
jgi:ribosomal protein S27AE